MDRQKLVRTLIYVFAALAVVLVLAIICARMIPAG